MNKLRSVQKIISVIGGIFCLYLGYDLFLKGITGEFDFALEFEGAKAQLASASPGIFFAFLGTVIIIVIVTAKETYQDENVNETFPNGATKRTHNIGSSGCFVSTAICTGLGMTDNCAELQILRSFRDHYLLHSKARQFLVRRYYVLSPKISEAIKNSKDFSEICLLLKEQYLNPCISNIESGKNIKAIALYIKMFLDLHNAFSNKSGNELTFNRVRMSSKKSLFSTILYGFQNFILFFRT